MDHFAQILLLLGMAVTVVVIFQRLHIPTSLGYLLVGIVLGPYTIGPSIYVTEFAAFAEFGVVFLLFTIGLNFSIPQLHALRHQVLGLGTGQVIITTLAIWIIVWLGAGVAPAAAFVIGAVYAQSSTTIIGSQLMEQGEENTHHGRIGLAMSVFQDVTAVPFLVVIPVLGVSIAASTLTGTLGWAFAKAVLAFAVVFVAGRWVLHPLFHFIAERRSAEVFTLAVLLVALLAAWTTSSLGLSLAFGGFLAGMILGETEFRHQVESSMRPFRDVLLGLFFVGIGMRFDPGAISQAWYWSLLGALLIVVSKTVIVAAMVRHNGIDALTAWRTGLLLSVGGEFGLALLVIAFDAGVVDNRLNQIAMTSVLLSMIVGALLIRFNKTIAVRLAGGAVHGEMHAELPEQIADSPEQQVLVGGYGRVGHAIAVLLHASNIPFVVFDTDAKSVKQGRENGHPVSYGDISDPGILTAIHVERASLVVIAVDDTAKALRTITFLRKYCPQVPIIARARDLDTSTRFLDAGATHAYPEAIEASLHLGETTLKMLNVADEDIDQVIQSVRDWGYIPVFQDKRDD